MKTLTALLLTLMLALPALAEAPTWLQENEVLHADLNGDGSEEAIVWRRDGEEHLVLEVTGPGGGTALYPTDIYWNEAVCLADLDGPALVLSGDGMDAPDSYTHALRYTRGGRFQELMFLQNDRQRVEDAAYTPSGWGRVVSIDGETLTVECTMDVLGTYVMLGDYKLDERDRFIPAGNWKVVDEDNWKYRVLTTAMDLEYTDTRGAVRTLPQGTDLVLIATDAASEALFAPREGLPVRFSIAPKEDHGWTVNGIDEREAFIRVPYAM